MPELDIVIVNWNAGAYLRKCLTSIAHASLIGISLRAVIVVDNASSDGSIDQLHIPGLPLRVLENKENVGFAAACNQGADSGQSPYILFLNPDVVVQSDSLYLPVTFLDKPENSKYAACSIIMQDNEGRLARHCVRFPQPRDFFAKQTGLDRLLPGVFSEFILSQEDHRFSQDVDHIIGAFYLVRRKVFSDLGGFDERFFVYYEDLDLSLRIHKAGWKIRYLTDAYAKHKGGGTTQQVKATRLFYSLRSKIQYCFKHFSWWSAGFLLFVTLLLEPAARIALAVSHGSLSEVKETLQACIQLWRWLLLSRLVRT